MHYYRLLLPHLPISLTSPASPASPASLTSHQLSVVNLNENGVIPGVINITLTSIFLRLFCSVFYEVTRVTASDIIRILAYPEFKFITYFLPQKKLCPSLR